MKNPESIFGETQVPPIAPSSSSIKGWNLCSQKKRRGLWGNLRFPLEGMENLGPPVVSNMKTTNYLGFGMNRLVINWINWLANCKFTMAAIFPWIINIFIMATHALMFVHVIVMFTKLTMHHSFLFTTTPLDHQTRFVCVTTVLVTVFTHVHLLMKRMNWSKGSGCYIESIF